MASDRKCQRATNPCLGLQNKASPSLSLTLVIPLAASPAPPPSTKHATSSLLSSPHTHTHTLTRVHKERPGCCLCLSGYLLSQHLVGEEGLVCLLTALRMLSSLSLSPATLPVLFSCRCGQAPYVGLNEAYP